MIAILLFALSLSVGFTSADSCPDQVRAFAAKYAHPPVAFKTLWFDRDSYFANFEPFQSVLLLADGGGVKTARDVAREFPTKRVVGTDIRVYPDLMRPPAMQKDLTELKNLEVAEVDTTKRLPYNDNEFELVFMEKGACICEHVDVCCGGMMLTPEGIRAFLREVARVLDKRSLHSMAFLHGAHQSPRQQAIWRAALEGEPSLAGFVLEPVRGPDGYYHAYRFRRAH